MKASSYLWEPITNGVELDGVDIIVFAGWSLLKLLTIAQLSVCVLVHAANLLVVGLVMHHRGLILCGVANGSSPGPCHVVETK